MTTRPRIAVSRVLCAGLFLMVFGFLWYGVLFQRLQLESHGYTAADYAGNSPLWYAGGGLISLAIAVGLAVAVRRDLANGWRSGARSGLGCALWFGLPLVTYPFVYSPHHEVGLYLAGAAHIIIGWTAAGGLLGQLEGRAGLSPAGPG